MLLFVRPTARPVGSLSCSQPMIDYSIYYRTTLPLERTWRGYSWDLFLSAFNSSERVLSVYGRVRAARKSWLVFPEYGFRRRELPGGACFAGQAGSESEFIQNLFGSLSVDLAKASVCIDITGFIRPYLIFLIK